VAVGEKKERPMGIEPTTSAWKAEVIPLYDGRVIIWCFAPDNFSVLGADLVSKRCQLVYLNFISNKAIYPKN
jgi:hypothetical protein